MAAFIIKNNPASLALTFGGVVGGIFFTTFGGPYTIPCLIMFALGITSFAFTSKFKASGDEPEPSGRKFQTIGVLFISGLLAFLILNLFVPELTFLNGQVTLTTPFGATAFAVGAIYSSAWLTAFIFNVFIVPPNEEQFFRVMMGNIVSKFTQGNPIIFLVQVPIVGAVPVGVAVVTGTIFATFHIAVYSLNLTTLVILWGAGSFLYFFDVKAGDPLPSMFAHMGNNAIAFLYSGNILAITFPSLAQYQPAPVVTFFIPVIGMALYVKYVKHRSLWSLR